MRALTPVYLGKNHVPEQILNGLELIKDTDPQEILKRALTKFQRGAISLSGAEDVILIDLVSRAAIT